MDSGSKIQFSEAAGVVVLVTDQCALFVMVQPNGHGNCIFFITGPVSLRPGALLSTLLETH